MIQSKYSKHGTVSVETKEGRLRLRLPRSLYEGKQKYISLGLPDTEENRSIAEEKRAVCERDIKLGMFDETFNKYKPGTHLTLVEPLKPKALPKLKELWAEYVEYVSVGKSPKTINGTYNPVTSYLNKIETDGLQDVVRFRSELLQVTTESQARRALIQLSAACKWGMKHRKVDSNPFEGMFKELEATEPNQAIAFTPEERDLIIESFRNDTRPGINYRHYAPFIEFLFLTGCRPCEAIGLRWGSITNDCSRVHFHESIVEVSGKLERREETKTGVRRWFSCGERLQTLLKSIKPDNPGKEDLVFPSPKGGAIGLSNFSDRAWSKVLESVNLLHKDGIKMTPYNCRDTFITLQICAGSSDSQVAKWAGNSPDMIRKKYTDKIKLEQIKPKEI